MITNNKIKLLNNAIESIGMYRGDISYSFNMINFLFKPLYNNNEDEKCDRIVSPPSFKELRNLYLSNIFKIEDVSFEKDFVYDNEKGDDTYCYKFSFEISFLLTGSEYGVHVNIETYFREEQIKKIYKKRKKSAWHCFVDDIYHDLLKNDRITSKNAYGILNQRAIYTDIHERDYEWIIN